MLQKFTGVVTVLGRTMLCAVFLAAAAGYSVATIHNVARVVGSKGIIASNWAFIGGIALLVIGSLSVAVGYKARFGASLLLVLLVLAMGCSHGFTFWTLVNTEARHEQVFHLLLHLSLMGAMLFIIGNGAGQMSLDWKR